MDYGDDSYSVITRDGLGVVRETEHSGDDLYVYISANGLLETAYEEPGNDVQDFFDYTFDTADIAPPRPWTGQSGVQITRDKNGAEVDRLDFSYRTRGLTTLTIGDCSFEAIAVQTYYDNPEGKSMVEFAYLMELGVPIITGFAGPGYVDPQKPTRILRRAE